MRPPSAVPGQPHQPLNLHPGLQPFHTPSCSPEEVVPAVSPWSLMQWQLRTYSRKWERRERPERGKKARLGERAGRHREGGRTGQWPCRVPHKGTGWALHYLLSACKPSKNPQVASPAARPPSGGWGGDNRQPLGESIGARALPSRTHTTHRDASRVGSADLLPAARGLCKHLVANTVSLSISLSHTCTHTHTHEHEQRLKMCSPSGVPPTKPLLPNPEPPRVSEPFPARPTQNGPCWDLPQSGQAATASVPQPCSPVCPAGVRGLWAAPSSPSSGLMPGVWRSPGPLRAQGPGAGSVLAPTDYTEALPSRGKHLQALDASLGLGSPQSGTSTR